MAGDVDSAIGSILPTPTDEEAAAISAAIAIVLQEAEARAAAARPVASSAAWRFSRRRWKRPTWK